MHIARSCSVITIIIVLSTLLAGCAFIPAGESQLKTPELAIQNAIAEQLGMPVSLRIETYRNSGGWAFLTGLPLTAERKRIDYSKTPYAGELHSGSFDDGFVALVKSTPGGSWTVVELSIGATDAPFIDWPEKRGVPKTLVMSGSD